MKELLVALVLFAALSGFAVAKELNNLDRNGVAIQGYDPVAFFTDNHPVKGSSQFQSGYQGAKYYFASAEHKAATENPQSTPRSSEATVRTEPARATPLLSKSKHGKSSTDGYLCNTTSISRTSSIKTNKAIFIRLIKSGQGLLRNMENELRGRAGC